MRLRAGASGRRGGADPRGRYDDEHEGVVVEYRNVKLTETHGAIVNELPSVHCPISATVRVPHAAAGLGRHAVR